MAKTLYRRFAQWKARIVSDLRKRWWGILVLAIVGFVGAMVASRLIDSANRFVDAHASFSGLKPLLAFLGNLSPAWSFWYSVAGAALFCIIGLFILVVHAYFESRSRGLSDRDPRVTLFYQHDTGGLGGNEYFILRNGGGVDAHNIQIQDIRLKNFLLRFPCIPLLGFQGAEAKVRAEIYDISANQVYKQVATVLEEDWMSFDTKDIKSNKGKVSYEGQIGYGDQKEEFLTEFALTYTLGSQTARIENFRFRRI